MALVAPLKNNEVEEYEEPIDAAVDGLTARGFYPHRVGTPNENIGIERDSSGNLVLKDEVAGSKTLTDLLSGTVPSHDLLPTLVHEVNATTFDEVAYTNGLITRFTTWTSSDKTQKVVEVLVGYVSTRISSVVSKRYDASGGLVQQMTEVIGWTGGWITSITRTRDL